MRMQVRAWALACLMALCNIAPASAAKLPYTLQTIGSSLGQATILPGATVTIYVVGGTTKANLFDASGAAIANPLHADSNGLVTFWADDGQAMYATWSLGLYTSPSIYFPTNLGFGLPTPTSTRLGGVKSSSAPANQFATGLDTTGAISYAQPSFSNLSGTIGASQLIGPGPSTFGAVKSSAAPANQFATGIDTSGVVSYARPTGSDVLYTPSGAGASSATLAVILSRQVWIDDYSAAHDGVTNDVTPLTNAMAALGAQGGFVNLSCAYNYYIGSNVTIPANVTVRHCRGAGWKGNPGTDWATGAIGSQPHVRLSSTATITLSSNSGYEGVVLRSGLTIPAADASTYAGIAFKLPSGGANDTKLDILAVGFATCVDGTNGGDRYRWQIECDGNPSAAAGAVIVGPSADSSEAKIRTYPWGTVAYPTSPVLTRTGYGIQILAGTQDDSRLDLFDFGHAQGVWTAATGNVRYRHVWTDNNASYGLHIFANDRSTFDAVYAYWNTGIRIENNAAINIGYYLCDTGTVANAECFEAAAGITSVTNFGFMDVKKATLFAINLGGTGSRVNIAAGSFVNVHGGVGPYIVGASGWDTEQVFISPSVTFDLAAGSSVKGGNVVNYKSLASAATLALPTSNSEFYITGTSNISNITGTWGGRQIMLRFNGVLTLDQTGNLLLATGKYTTAVGSYLRLVFDQDTAKWVEVGRSPTTSAGNPTASACGTSPSVDSGSSSGGGKVTFGSAATACTLTFATAFPNAAYCAISPMAQPAAVGSIPYVSAQSRTAFTISGGVASASYLYSCSGN